MHTASLRKVGGSIMLAIPRSMLEELRVGPGKLVGLSVEGGRIVIEPRARPRYSLEELLAQGGDPEAPLTEEDREWFDAPPTGREVI